MPVPSVRRTYNKGFRGVAKLDKTDKSLIVTLPNKDASAADRFAGGEQYEFLFDDEDAIKSENAASRPAGPAYVELSFDKKSLISLRPASGSLYVKFVGLAHGKDSPPTPKRYEGTGHKRDGSPYPYSYEAFTALLEVTQGAWTGAILTVNLRYLFVDSGDGEVAGIRQGGSHAATLNQFLELAGMDFATDTIPLTDNVLPWLGRTLADRGKTFMAVVDNGWVVAFGPPPV